MLKGHLLWVNSAVFSPDSRYIVSASSDHTARIWDTVTGDCQTVLEGHSATVISAVFSADVRHIVSASCDCTTRIWDTATGNCQEELNLDHSVWISSTIFFSHGVLLSQGFDKQTHMYLTPVIFPGHISR